MKNIFHHVYISIINYTIKIVFINYLLMSYKMVKINNIKFNMFIVLMCMICSQNRFVHAICQSQNTHITQSNLISFAIRCYHIINKTDNITKTSPTRYINDGFETFSATRNDDWEYIINVDVYSMGSSRSLRGNNW